VRKALKEPWALKVLKEPWALKELKVLKAL
jgi:hypothetical protein